MQPSLFNTLYSHLKRLIKQDLHCPHTMALSVCTGIYIAFSPFIALHTVMVIIAAYFFSLNGAVMFAVSNLINNPWTMIPVYGADYMCGKVIFEGLHIDAQALNPHWMNRINSYIQHYIAVPDFSFWTFMIGGNVLGMTVAIIAYPFVKQLLVRWLKQYPTGM